MIYLLEYDRGSGRLHSLRSFAASEALAAAHARLELELDLTRRSIEREIVLLEAASDEDLMRTHRRYFARLDELSSVNNLGGASTAE